LYSSTGAGLLLYRDTFNNTDRIEVGSSLLNADECYVDTSGGIVTLPIDVAKEKTIIISETPVIRPTPSASSTYVGNNFQSGAAWNGSIRTVIDGDEDTWFEYEKVIQNTDDDRSPLILDLLLNLGQPTIVNFIRINPNNFGTNTSVRINAIETSLDGVTFQSIKDDLPITGYLSESEEDIFQLSASTSKYAGQGLFSFTPRRAKYVRCSFSQSEPYVIETSSGEKLRYAIGLRTIELKAITYKNKGELISTPVYLDGDIVKVSLRTTQSPVETSPLAGIKHFLSVDDGSSWHEIRPQQDSGVAAEVNEIPEILNFNNDADSAIITPTPPVSIRYKAQLFRDDSAFASGAASLLKSKASISELYDAPKSAPHSIDLKQSPIEGTVSVVDPQFGSCGIQNQELVLARKGADNSYFLPRDWTNELRPYAKSIVNNQYVTERVSDGGWFHLAINNKQWESKCAGSIDDFSDYSIEDEVFSVDWENRRILFGDGLSGGKSPENERVSLYFEPERLAATDGPGSAIPLTFQASPNKKGVTVKQISPLAAGMSTVPKGVTVLRLKHQNIKTIKTPILGSEAAFVNGVNEFLVGSYTYSVDYKGGVVYLSSPNVNLKILSYTYWPTKILGESDWAWGTSNTIKDSIVIQEQAWSTHEGSLSIVPSGLIGADKYLVHLPNLSIVKNSVNITSTGPSGVLSEEVPFIDGSSELGGLTLATETLPSFQSGVNIVDPGEVIAFEDGIAYELAPDPDAQEYFVTEVATLAEVTEEGDFFVDLAANRIYIFSSEADEKPGKLTYWYSKSNQRQGLFSIDYARGMIYSRNDLSVLSSLDIAYEYTNYEISYPIARSVSGDSYSVDYVNGVITFNSSEIAESASFGNSSQQYLVSYDFIKEYREDLAQLKEYFSPVLKDYLVKLLPRS